MLPVALTVGLVLRAAWRRGRSAMGSRFPAAAFTVLGVVCVGFGGQVGCGLEQGGLATAYGDEGDGGVASEGGARGPTDSAPPCAHDASSCSALRADGWIPVAYAESLQQCPAGYGSEQHPITQPVATDAACVCVASTVMPECQTGMVTTKYDIDLTGLSNCNFSGNTYAVAGGNCLQRDVGYFQHGSQQPVQPSGAACSATPNSDIKEVSVTPTTTCEPVACAGALCSGEAPLGFLSCITHAGTEVACPAGFSTRQRVLGTGPSLDCGACTCAVSDVKCTNARFEMFEDKACAKRIEDFVSNGTCQSAKNPTASKGSYRYTATPNATFTVGTSMPTTGVLGAVTICCRPGPG